MPGYVDFLDNFQVSGWALENDHRTPDDVVICADRKQLARVRPTAFREDLRAKGWGDGLCGFKFFFPEPLSVLRETQVSVSSASSGELLGERSVAPGGLLFGGQTQYPHALGRVGYAASATRGQRDGKSLQLHGRILAPTDSVIRFVPAEEEGSVAVHPAKSVVMPVPFTPEGAPVFRYRRVRCGYSYPTSESICCLQPGRWQLQGNCRWQRPGQSRRLHVLPAHA